MSKGFKYRLSSLLFTLGLGLLLTFILNLKAAKSNDWQQQIATASNIKHLVVFIQENHSFDNYFGTYCKAPPGSNPQCTTGPECCEAIPALDPGSKKPFIVLADADNGKYDPNHTMECESSEMNDGKMDKYVSASCGDARNFSVFSPSVMQPYWDLAQNGALADRYFQPIVGASSANDMYLARASFVFKDDDVEPDAIGSMCSYDLFLRGHFSDPTIGDFLTQANTPWSFYAEGYDAMVRARNLWACPKPPSDCPIQWALFPCSFDPSDNPFAYYLSSQDKPQVMKDLNALLVELENGTLPAVSFVKALAYKTEHPGWGITVSAGANFITQMTTAIRNSLFGPDTLILVTWDESGGYFDHITPPPTSTADSQPYGARIPLIAVGPFAKKGTVSHVTMEHSSIVKFIEWNWLGQKTGQLQTRDAEVNNIGSLLDPEKTGALVP